jgi:hypothetical protein
MDLANTRICSQCKLPKNKFYTGRAECVDCCKEKAKLRAKTPYARQRQKERYKNNPEKYRLWKRAEYNKNSHKYIERSRKWRDNNKEKASLIDKRYRMRARAISTWFKVMRGGKCEICKYDKNLASLHWHHRYDKSFAISKLVRSRDILMVLAIEIAKCDLLCANCHSDIHHPNLSSNMVKPWFNILADDEAMWRCITTHGDVMDS